MVQDGTFGTHFEFTPKGTLANDFVNLSTNYGSGPRSPPKLCDGPNVDPNDCMAKAAVIFLQRADLCAGQDAGQVKFVNSCPYSLTFNSSGPSRVDNVPELFFHDEGHAGEGRKVLGGELSGCVSTSDR